VPKFNNLNFKINKLDYKLDPQNIDTQGLISKKKVMIYKPLKSRTELFSLTSGEKLFKMRHFPAAIKEWKNSVYSYNKSSIRNIASMDDMATRLIKSYFYFSHSKTSARSRRMRSLRRKYTSKRLFASKPEIKQTNDKVIVTVYTFNREKNYLLKKLFFHDRRKDIIDNWRNKLELSPVRKDLTYYKSKQVAPDYDHLVKANKTNKGLAFVNMNHNSKVSASKVVNNNRNLYPELVTNIVSQQEKERLYKSLHAKLARSVNMSKIKGKYLKSNANSRGKQQFYYIATASKVDRYNRKRSKLFKKKPEPAKKPWYIRKKMKRFPAELPELTRSQKRKVAKRIIPSTGIKHKTEMNFLSFRLLLKSRKFAYARKLFYYYFLKYVLSMFNVRVFAFKESNVPSKQIIHDIVDSNLLKDIEKDIKKKRKGKRNKKSKFAYNIDKKSTRLYEAPLSLTPQGTRVKIYFHILEKNQTLIEKMIKDKTNKDISDYLKFNKPIVVNVDLLKTVANNSLAINKSNDLDYVLSNVNFVVSQFLDKVLAKSGITEKERKLKVMFKKFSKGHYSRYLSKLWKEKALFKSNYTKFMVNRFKFSKFLPNLKVLISKFYNKKVELNIINLKHSYLNTEIYTDTIALKLRKRMSLVKVIRRALYLPKKPLDYVDRTRMNIDYDVNKLSRFNIYKSVKFINLNIKNKLYDISLQKVLNKMYPRSLVNSSNNIPVTSYKKSSERISPSKLKNILNIIKYKTISGVRLEGAGRLTRRYTASRAVYKFRYRGSLRNIDYSRRIEFLRRSMPTVMLRNQVKANAQYSLDSKKRRIGTFGIKGWISGY
jgi:hypothetical protein